MPNSKTGQSIKGQLTALLLLGVALWLHLRRHALQLTFYRLSSPDLKKNQLTALLLLGVAACVPQISRAQNAEPGFSLDRFYPSAAGGGWLVMDSLEMQGGLGGAAELTTHYASRPLRVQGLSVISKEAIEEASFAVTYQRYRLSINLPSPLLIKGSSDSAGGFNFTAPNVDMGTQPDTLADIRLGFDMRILGEASSAFRLGVGGQFFVPSGNRSDYESDGTYRKMIRLLVAGDQGSFTYAGQMGIHIRSLYASALSQAPQGNEFLFGWAGGFKFPSRVHSNWVVGAEFYGASAFHDWMSSHTTAFESLISTRLEKTLSDGRLLRLKVGAGPGINAQFGAAEWRAVLAFELSGEASSSASSVSPTKSL